MIEFIDLKDWKTKSEIMAEFKAKGINLNERTWRMYVEKFNERYCEGTEDSYIVHSCKGYKMTKDTAEIKDSIDDLRKRGINMLWKVSKAKRAMGDKMNLKLDLEEREII